MEPLTEIKINRLPALTWNQLGMNESILKDEDAGSLYKAEPETPVRIVSKEKEKIERTFCFSGKEKENKVQEIELTAERESSLTLWAQVSSKEAEEGFFKLDIKIHAKEQAKVRLILVQLLGESDRFVNQIKADCGEGATVELLQLFLGGAKTWVDFGGNLEGKESSIEAEIGYYCKNTQRLDMNYVINHKEKNTESRILVSGVLTDQAFKLFRGTIDFKQGSAASRGEETEEVLMLGEDAVCQTIPLILCAEEDVQGNHGATIGEPEEEVLFYMASRGIEKEAAAKILARAKIDGLCARIGNKELEEKVQQYLEVMGNE